MLFKVINPAQRRASTSVSRVLKSLTQEKVNAVWTLYQDTALKYKDSKFFKLRIVVLEIKSMNLFLNYIVNYARVCVCKIVYGIWFTGFLNIIMFFFMEQGKQFLVLSILIYSYLM